MKFEDVLISEMSDVERVIARCKLEFRALCINLRLARSLLSSGAYELGTLNGYLHRHWMRSLFDHSRFDVIQNMLGPRVIFTPSSIVMSGKWTDLDLMPQTWQPTARLYQLGPQYYWASDDDLSRLATA